VVDILYKETPYMFSGNIKIKQMTLIGLMTAILCILAPLSLPLPLSPVPVSFGNMAVCFVVAVLGAKRGFLSVFLYILLGLAGLPIFSGFSGGIGKLLGPTGGYLIGYLFLALLFGFFVEHFHNRVVTNICGAVIGMILLYLFGTLWLAFQLNMDFISALWAGAIPYIPIDIIKITLAIILGSKLRKHLFQAQLI